MLTMRYLLLVAVASIPTTATAMQTAEPQPLVFQVRFNEQVYAKPFTGQVLVLLSKRGGEPRFGPNWFNTEPFFSKEVKNWQPGTLLRIDATARGYPGTLDKLAPGTYTIQAVLDHELDRAIGTAAGNAFSKPVQRELNPRTSGPIDLQITEVIKPQTFHERENVKLVDIESKLLSAFHGRPVRLRAGVILPKSFAKQPEKRYPVIYDIPGFSGNHFFALFHGQNATDVAGVEMIYVHLDPDCPTGHHVFADSANNGPCGRALLEELIPHIEQRFRGIGKPTARFVTGHSSGGWSSLWLQVTYPDFFGGCWSTAPDPVDFRDFQRINIYKPGTNMFKDEQGRDRPLARRGDQPVLFYKPFSDMEEVTGHGGQLQSFEAVFSPKGPDGKPRKLWNRQTGAIDLEVAKAWEKYDIRLVLERNWPALAPRLQGKLHVYMGDKDTFYLEGATRLLKESLAKLGSDAKVELFPGKDHSTLVDSNLRRRIAQEMAQAFRQHHPEGK